MGTLCPAPAASRNGTTRPLPVNSFKCHWLITTSFGWLVCASSGFAASPMFEVRQITTGPLHHFFGYIGHVQNVPWNRSGRYIVALQTSVRDHLPDANEPPNIVLLVTKSD